MRLISFLVICSCLFGAVIIKAQSVLVSYPASGALGVALTDSIRISVNGAIDTAAVRLWTHDLEKADSARYHTKPHVYIIAAIDRSGIPDSLQPGVFLWAEPAIFSVEGDTVIVVHPNQLNTATKYYIYVDSLPVSISSSLYYVSAIDSFTTVLPNPQVEYYYAGTEYAPKGCTDSSVVKLTLPIDPSVVNTDSLVSIWKVDSYTEIDSVRLL